MVDTQVQAFNASEPSSSAAAQQPFRFLDLPKAIRLMVYKSLPTLTRYRQIHIRVLGGRMIESSVVTKSIPGVAVIYTCHEIHAEAVTLLRKKVQSLMSEPLRLIIEWDDLNGFALEDLLRCAASSRACGNNVLHSILRFQDAPADRTLRKLYGPIPRCDFTSYDDLQRTLRQNNLCHSSRRVEIAVVYDTSPYLYSLVYRVHEFYEFVREMGTRKSMGENMSIVLRPKLKRKPVAEPLKQRDEEQSGNESWLHECYPLHHRWKAWTCDLGEKLDVEEWAASWAQGEQI